MQFHIHALIVSFAAISTAFALPASDATSSTAARKISKDFYLKSSLLPGPGSSNHRFNNLWVQPFHTGAGLNDVILEGAAPTPSSSQTFYLNGTRLQLNLSSVTPDIPWTFINVQDETAYSGWQPTRINVGYGTEAAYSHYSINGSGLQWNDSPGHREYNQFGGWRVCDWWHNAPQLFWILESYHDKIPSSCSNIDLIPEYITY